MSNATAQTIDQVIPLGRRIGEIMEEKGDAFSIRAFSQRLGMSKDMLSRCINGDRYIKPSELDKIAKGLNLLSPEIRIEIRSLVRYNETIGGDHYESETLHTRVQAVRREGSTGSWECSTSGSAA